MGESPLAVLLQEASTTMRPAVPPLSAGRPAMGTLTTFLRRSPSRVRTEAPMSLLLTTNSLVVLPLAHMLASTLMLRAMLMPTLPAARRTAALMALKWMPLVRARLALMLTQWDLRIASLPRPRARAWERVPRALILGSDFSATGYTNAFTQNTPFW